MMKKMPKIKLNVNTLIIAVTVLLSGFFVVKGLGYGPVISACEQKQEEMRAETAYEEEKVKEIDEDRKNIDTPEFKEKTAREKLGMVKKGEKVYIDLSGQE